MKTTNDNLLDQSQFMINEKTFSIATNNVQGLSEPVKQAQIMTYVMDSKFDIFGLAETKLKFHTAELLYKNHPSYLSWWGCSEDHTDSTGVGLIFHRHVAQYIQSVRHYKGRVIYAKLFMKGKFKLCIIQVYIQAHHRNKTEKLESYKYIIDLINQCRKEHCEVIIMGDFNVDPEELGKLDCSNSRSIHWKYKLIRKLQSNHFIDLSLQFHNPPIPTWSSKNVFRRLDQIWIQSSLQPDALYSSTFLLIFIILIIKLFLQPLLNKECFKVIHLLKKKEINHMRLSSIILILLKNIGRNLLY